MAAGLKVVGWWVPRATNESPIEDVGTYRLALEGPLPTERRQARQLTTRSAAALRSRSALHLTPTLSIHSHSTGTRMGAPLAFSSTTTNLAGSVLLALRPTT